MAGYVCLASSRSGLILSWATYIGPYKWKVKRSIYFNFISWEWKPEQLDERISAVSVTYIIDADPPDRDVL